MARTPLSALRARTRRRPRSAGRSGDSAFPRCACAPACFWRPPIPRPAADEIRRSDAPRLVDLVRDAQQSVDRLAGERDAMVSQIDNHHGGSPGADAALAAITHRADVLAADAGLDPMRGPGLVVTLDGCAARRRGPLPRRRLPRRPGRASAGRPGRPERAVDRGRRRRPDAGSAAHRHVGSAVRGQHAAAQRAHLQSAVRHHRGRRRGGDAGRAGRRRRWSRSTSSTWCGSASATPRSRGTASSWWDTRRRCACASPSRPGRLGY